MSYAVFMANDWNATVMEDSLLWFYVIYKHLCLDVLFDFVIYVDWKKKNQHYYMGLMNLYMRLICFYKHGMHSIISKI